MNLAALLFIPLVFSSCSLIGRSTVTENNKTTIPAAKKEAREKIEKIVIPNKKYAVHKVRKGETLYRISKNFKVPIEDIAEFNSIEDATKISVGQVLRIPGADSFSTAEKPLPVSKISNGSDSFLRSWPLHNVDRKSVIRKFGRIYNEELGIFTNNNGIDIKPRTKEIIAVNNGVVTYLDFLKGIGLMVGFQVDAEYYVFYYPCEEVKVKKGEKIVTGQVVAKVSGEILHFEVRKKKLPLNPLLFLP